MKYTQPKKRKATRIMADDYIEIGGTIYRILTSESVMFGNRIHIGATPIDGDNVHERISLFVPPLAKFKVFNQK